MVKRRLRVYDLCCGYGGWAAGFLAEGYEVIGFDIEPMKKYPGQMVCQDIRTINRLPGADVIVASPPCTGFSTARPDKVGRPNEDDFSIELAARRVIYNSKPKYWVIENVRGAVKYLGHQALRIGPFFFWGYFPDFFKPYEKSKKGWTRFSSSGYAWNPIKDPRARAVIPFEISRAFAEACKR